MGGVSRAEEPFYIIRVGDQPEVNEFYRESDYDKSHCETAWGIWQSGDGARVRYAIALIVGLTSLMCGCSSRDEVSRVTSPDNRIDAIVFETNCGAPCSFGYEIELATRGARHGYEVASLDGASRHEQGLGR